MMHEAPPQNVGKSMPTSSSGARGIALNKTYVTSIAGIATTIAFVCSFCAMISYEVFKGKYGLIGSSPTFHEFTVVTSFLFLLGFTLIAALQIHKMISITSTAMTFIMIGHSGLWFLFTLISSSLMADVVSKVNAASGSLLDVTALQASAAFGFLECFSLLGAVIALVLNLLNIFRNPTFE